MTTVTHNGGAGGGGGGGLLFCLAFLVWTNSQLLRIMTCHKSDCPALSPGVSARMAAAAEEEGYVEPLGTEDDRESDK